MGWLKELFAALLSAVPELFKVLRKKDYSISTLAPGKGRSNKKKTLDYVKNRLDRYGSK